MHYLLIFLCVSVNSLDVLVHTKIGPIQGLEATDGDYLLFMGIPYAKVDPENPFGPSTPYPLFNKTFEATNEPAYCPQIDDFSHNYTGTIDCLHLNIYTPKSAITNKFPILVFIHGGGFMNGYSGRHYFDPKLLIQHDIIFITFNYRVGPYGFFCLNPKIPGNQGLKDQLLAFRWIKDNIDAFGGDTDKITVFGSSMGARSVEMHLYSNHEKLFNQAIVSSESAMSPWAIIKPDLEAPCKIANSLGFVTKHLDEAIEFLAKQNSTDVVNTVDKLNMKFGVCLEAYDKKFVSDYPMNKRTLSKVKDMPILMGFTNNEWLVFYYMRMKIVNRNLVRRYLKETFDCDNKIDEMTRRVEIVYNLVNKIGIIEFGSDFEFVHPILRSINKYIRSGAGNIYLYKFSYNGGRNFIKKMRHFDETGATHGDELGYIFNMSALNNTFKGDDRVMSDRMIEMYTNFVKYGNPTPNITKLLPVKWEPVTKEVFNYLDINSELTPSRDPFPRRMAFWDSFYEDYWKCQKGYSEGN